MRSFQIHTLLVAISILCIMQGCSTPDPYGQRQTALLRAEILDLEDRYYSMKSQHDMALAQLQAYQGQQGLPVQSSTNSVPDEMQSQDDGFLDDLEISTGTLMEGARYGYGGNTTIVQHGCQGCGQPLVSSQGYHAACNSCSNAIVYEQAPVMRSVPMAQPQFGGFSSRYPNGPTRIENNLNRRRFFDRNDSVVQSLRSDSRIVEEPKPRGLFGLREKFRNLTQRKTAAPTLNNPRPAIVVNDNTNLEIIPPGGQRQLTENPIDDLEIEIPGDDDVANDNASSILTAPVQDQAYGLDDESYSIDMDDLEISMGSPSDRPNLEMNASQPATNAPEYNYDVDDLDLEAGYSSQRNLGYDSTAVADVYINPLSTRGADIDGKPGDEGLVLMIQPRNSRGETLLAPAPMTISLIDPSLPAQSQRVGFWKFAASEIDLFLANDELADRGYLLNLPWDTNPPKNESLLVFVRYETSDGRRLENSYKIMIRPPAANYSSQNAMVEGWTRRGTSNIPFQNNNNSLQDGNIRADQTANQRLLEQQPSTTPNLGSRRPAWKPVR